MSGPTKIRRSHSKGCLQDLQLHRRGPAGGIAGKRFRWLKQILINQEKNNNKLNMQPNGDDVRGRSNRVEVGFGIEIQALRNVVTRS
jgi:hypothetical protein